MEVKEQKDYQKSIDSTNEYGKNISAQLHKELIKDGINKYDSVTLDDFYGTTKANWLLLKDFIPIKNPDYISYRKNYKYYNRWHDCKANKGLELLSDDDYNFTDNMIENNLDKIIDFLELDKEKVSHWFIDFNDDVRVYYYTDKESSIYFYGEDEGGQYIIRGSDHWGKVGLCFWDLFSKDAQGESELYDNTYQVRDENDDTDEDYSYYEREYCYGKAYLSNFIDYKKKTGE